MGSTFKHPRASEICDMIRSLYNINVVREGWIARPHHGLKQIRIGHHNYGTDPAITDQVDALAYALQRVGIPEDIGYELIIVTA